MAKRNRNRRRIWMVVLGCCCIIAAATLSTYNHLDQARAAREAQQLADQLAQLLEDGSLPSNLNLPDDVGIVPLGDDQQVPARAVSGYDICGVLSIPDIGVRLAVINDWSYPNLTVSVCRYSGSADDQMIVLGHNYRGHFGSLKNLQIGDALSFSDVDGNLHDYTVSASLVYAEDQMYDIMAGDDWDLTLLTCTYGGANRVVVRAVRAG